VLLTHEKSLGKALRSGINDSCASICYNQSYFKCYNYTAGFNSLKMSFRKEYSSFSVITMKTNIKEDKFGFDH
jgi:hypothetical protein